MESLQSPGVPCVEASHCLVRTQLRIIITAEPLIWAATYLLRWMLALLCNLDYSFDAGAFFTGTGTPGRSWVQS